MNETLTQKMRGLRTLRLRKGISLPQIARATRISMCYLDAIEEQRWDRLPGGVYSLNYIRQYIEAIDPAQNRDWVAGALAPSRLELPSYPTGQTWTDRLRKTVGAVLHRLWPAPSGLNPSIP